MTTSDIVDAVLFVKLADSRTFQVCLTQERAKQVAHFAAMLARLDGQIPTLYGESDVEWERDLPAV
jgi:hypothetical protein